MEKLLYEESVYSRTQHPNERARDYVVVMRRLAAQMKVSEDVLCPLIIRGLKPSIRRYVAQQTPKTIDEVMAVARSAELGEDVWSADTDKKIEAMMKELKHLGDRIERQSTVLSINRRSPTPDRRHVSFSDRENRSKSPNDGIVVRTGNTASEGQRQSNSGERWRSNGRSQQAPRRGGTMVGGRVCSRCGKSTCPGNRQCHAFVQGLICYRCGIPGHLSVACQRGVRRGNQPTPNSTTPNSQ